MNPYMVRTVSSGAGERNRTSDLRITNALLYQLSYTGVPRRLTIFSVFRNRCPSRQDAQYIDFPEDCKSDTKKNVLSLISSPPEKQLPLPFALPVTSPVDLESVCSACF